jgi:hypothetical protein
VAVTYQAPNGPAQPFKYPATPAGNAWTRMKTGQKFGLIVAALLLPCCGGVALIGAFADDPGAGDAGPADKPAAAEQLADGTATAEPNAVPAETTSTEPVATTPATVTPTPTTAQPVVRTSTVVETRKVPYATREVADDSLAEGTTKVRTKGVNGVRTITYHIVMTDGVQTAKKVLRSQVTKKAVTKVVAVGTKVEEEEQEPSGCDPNYSGCVPIASDVDCEGGSGNGPAYVSGPVRVTGSDIYDLDRDGDGTACD